MNETKPICPLLSLQENLRLYCTCKEEGCAWWIENKQKCAITVIGGKK